MRKWLLFVLLILACGTAKAQTATCGTASVGSSQDQNNANWVFGTPCLTGSNASGYNTITAFYWVGTPSATTFDLGVYTDANNPTTLLCHTGAQQITPIAGWNSIAIPGCPTLQPNKVYWIGYDTGSNTVQQFLTTGSCPGTTQFTSYFSVQTTSPVLPPSFGSAITATAACYSFYLTMNAVGGPSLTSITVSPATATIPINGSQGFTETAHFSDGTTGTVGVTWSSSNQSAALINSSGVATGLAAGATTISASFGTVIGTAQLTVAAPPPSTHTVGISWTQSTIPTGTTCSNNAPSAAVTSNRVYRGLSSGGEALLNTSTAPTTAFTDSSVLSQTTYFYYVTALNCNGESLASQEVSATMPTNSMQVPNAPTGLQSAPN